MEYCIEKIESVLNRKLIEIVESFAGRELKCIDIGVFPWHTKIELSFLFSDENADVDDVAAWPHFDYTKMSEGGWADALELAKSINGIWEQDHDAMPIFMDFGTAATSEIVSSTIMRFNLAPEFFIQVLDPDDSDGENFCA